MKALNLFEHQVQGNPHFLENKIELYEKVQIKKIDLLDTITTFIWDHLHPEPIKWPIFTGWINIYLFFIQGITGVLLLLYYRPTTSEAYESIQEITYSLNYGWLIRGIHIWAVHLLIVCLILHIFYILFNPCHRAAPRITWIIGGLMMTMIGLLGATGYLLPWAQTSYWATTFVTQIPTAIPFMGELIKILARGGNEVSQLTLSRFFALHILIIPLFFTLFSILHIFSIKRSIIPKDLLFHLMVFLIIMAILCSLSTFFPPKIYPKADPFCTQLNIKPEWYFLASFEVFQLSHIINSSLSHIINSSVGNAISIILAFSFQLTVYLWLLFFPYITPMLIRGRRSHVMLIITGFLIFLVLTFSGYYR